LLDPGLLEPGLLDDPGLFVELGDDGEPVFGVPLMPPRSDEESPTF
jgi:hypothetical protein